MEKSSIKYIFPLFLLLAAFLFYIPQSSVAQTIPKGKFPNLPPAITFFDGPITLSVDQVGSWTIKANDLENTPMTFSANWGDSGPIQNSVSGIFRHAYTKPGTYSAVFTVTDSDKDQNKKTVSVTVGDTGGKTIITNLEPTSGPAGTVVIINGSGFGASNNIMFDGSIPNIKSENGTKLSFTVPPNTTSNQYGVSVLNNSSSDFSNTATFTVTDPSTEPSIRILSPNGGEAISPSSPYLLTWQALNMPQNAFITVFITDDKGNSVSTPIEKDFESLKCKISNQVKDCVSISQNQYELKSFTKDLKDGKYKVKIKCSLPTQYVCFYLSKQNSDTSDDFFTIGSGQASKVVNVATTSAPAVSATPTKTFVGTPISCYPFFRDLKKGDKGPDVIALQQLLMKLTDRNGDPYLSRGTQVGTYGPGTQTALLAYQNKVIKTAVEPYFGTKTREFIGVGCPDLPPIVPRQDPIIPYAPEVIPVPTKTISPSVSPKPTPSQIKTPVITTTPTPTPVITTSPSASPSPTLKASATPTPSATPVPTTTSPTPSPTPTATPTASAAPTATFTSSPSSSPSSTASKSPTSYNGRKSNVASLFESFGGWLDWVTGF